MEIRRMVLLGAVGLLLLTNGAQAESGKQSPFDQDGTSYLTEIRSYCTLSSFILGARFDMSDQEEENLATINVATGLTFKLYESVNRGERVLGEELASSLRSACDDLVVYFNGHDPRRGSDPIDPEHFSLGVISFINHIREVASETRDIRFP